MSPLKINAYNLVVLSLKATTLKVYIGGYFSVFKDFLIIFVCYMMPPCPVCNSCFCMSRAVMSVCGNVCGETVIH